MNETEKVITAIENCIAVPKCRDCPWEDCEEEHETRKLPLSLVEKALAMLRKRVPKDMIFKHYEIHYASYDEYENRTYCPECKVRLIQEMNYCPRCGQALKW